jgi:hypothetical protein
LADVLVKKADVARRRGTAMKWVKYVAASFCALLAIGTVPSVYFIAVGLTGSQIEDPIHFSAKLLAYVLEIVILGIAAVKFYRSARSEWK